MGLTMASKSDKVPNKVVSIPTEWTLFEVPANIFEILGNRISEPSHIVVEALVQAGLARKVRVVHSGIEVHGDESPTDDTALEGPWAPGVEDDD